MKFAQSFVAGAFALVVLSGSAIVGSAATSIIDIMIDTGAAERIDAADRLRTLTQEIPSAACHYYNGVAPDESRRLLVEARDDFDKLLDALYFGNVGMNIIGEETNRKTLADLDKVKAIWADMRPAVETLLDSPQDDAAISVIKARNMELFDVSAHLLSELTGEYTNPAELLQVDAIMLDMTGRQSMMTQMMAKDACKIWTGTAKDDIYDNLQATLDTFDLILNALRFGMPDAGIKKAPTPEIAASLDEIAGSWDVVKADLETAIETHDLDEEARVRVYKNLNKKMYQFDEVVHMYAEFAKHRY